MLLPAMVAVTMLGSSCAPENRNPNRTITMRVVDSIPQTALEEVYVELFRFKSRGLYNPTSEKIIVGTANTDSDGSWTLQFFQQKDKYYHLEVSHPDYYIHKSYFELEEEVDSVLMLAPKGQVDIRVENTSGAEGKVIVKLQNTYEYQGSMIACWDEPAILKRKDAVAGAWNRIEIRRYDACNTLLDPVTEMDSVFVPLDAVGEWTLNW